MEKMLKEFPLFNKLTSQELKKISQSVSEASYKAGDVICKKGEKRDKLYLIKKGTVEIILPLYKYDEKQHVVSHLHEGTFFGELSFFDGKFCSADVLAKEDVKLLELKKSDYDEIINSDPETGYDIQNKIIQSLIHIIKNMNEKYSYNAFIR